MILFLGRVPDDYGILRRRRLQNETKALFRRTFDDTGIEHGTITVLVDKEGVRGDNIPCG